MRILSLPRMIPLAPCAALAKASAKPLARRRTGRRGAQILHRPRHSMTQLASRAERPVRIAQQFAREHHAVRVAATYDFVGLRWRRDETHGTRRDPRLTLDLRGKRDLIAGTDRDVRVRH